MAVHKHYFILDCVVENCVSQYHRHCIEYCTNIRLWDYVRDTWEDGVILDSKEVN